MPVILSRVGTTLTRLKLTPDSSHVLKLAARHEVRVGTLLSIAWQLPPSVSAAISHWSDPPAAALSRWMDELSIYPDELFSIMAQRATIYATAESFT